VRAVAFFHLTHRVGKQQQLLDQELLVVVQLAGDLDKSISRNPNPMPKLIRLVRSTELWSATIWTVHPFRRVWQAI
jgi:hypothetical protein